MLWEEAWPRAGDCEGKGPHLCVILLWRFVGLRAIMYIVCFHFRLDRAT